MKKVVVTGIGCVTPIGMGREAFARGLEEGRSAAANITKFDASHFPVKRACEIKDFSASAAFSVLDPFIQYGLTAAAEAVADSGLDVQSMDPFRIGVAVSSSKGGFTTFEKFSERFAKKPSALLGARIYANFIPNILCQWIARRWKLQGPAKPVVAACATGLYAVMEGIRMIEQDEADVCFAGASDASITPFLLAGYHQLGVLARDEIRPFDSRRDGFLIGEGAGVVMLESEEHALSRHAKCYGKILGHAYGNECLHPILFPPEGDGLKRCLERLMASSGISSQEIDSLELHGTGTKGGDLYETVQIKQALGKDAYRISASSIKSMTGHTVGAAGALSFIASLISLRDQFVPPTINLTSPDPACDLDYTPNVSKKRNVRVATTISMGFGGHIGAVLVGK